jgi:acetyltransferase-like isoleucine patch superfamily enzyme
MPLPALSPDAGPVRRLLACEPPLWALCVGLRQLCMKIKSAVTSRMLGAPGLYLGPGCVIRGARRISFGRNLFAHKDLWLEAVTSYRGQSFNPKITIGDNVSFSDAVHITAIHEVKIGTGVLMASRVYISDHNHGAYSGPQQSAPEEPPSDRMLSGAGATEVGDNVWIGDNVVVIGPLVIGKGAVIGANSVVSKDVPPGAIVAGAPARLLKQFNPVNRVWERV